MDSGTITIVIRPRHEDDGLEIADLNITVKQGIEWIGAEALSIHWATKCAVPEPVFTVTLLIYQRYVEKIL